MADDLQDHPAVARRRVRLALRRARAASGMSQTEVAGRLHWSLSKVQRIEIGEVTVSVTDLRALTDLYGGFSPERIGELAEAARIARRSRWSISPEYRELLTPATIDLMGFEAHAKVISAFQPVVIPGVLQTPEIANNILQFWETRGLLSAEQKRVRREVRAVRRRQIVESGGLDYRLILDESVLSRVFGDVPAMAAQMEALEEAARHDHVGIRVLPLNADGLLGLIGAFTVVELGADDAVLYSESGSSDKIVDDHRVVADHQRHFATMWDQSLGEEATGRLIGAKKASLLAELDRQMPNR